MESHLDLLQAVIQTPEGVTGSFRRHIPAGQLALPGQGAAGVVIFVLHDADLRIDRAERRSGQRATPRGCLFRDTRHKGRGSAPLSSCASHRRSDRAKPGPHLDRRRLAHPGPRAPRFEANLLRIVSSHIQEALSRVRELATET